MRSYVAIHMALIFGVGGLLTGAIWAKASWGHWWVWSEPTLVSFLIVVLLFATYQPLRFSIEDPERQARYASVFAIVAGAFVPLNFIAVRLAQGFVHPRVLTLTGGNLPGSMRLAFMVSLIGIALLYATLVEVRDGGQERADQAAAAASIAARRRRGQAAGKERGAVMSLDLRRTRAPAPQGGPVRGRRVHRVAAAGDRSTSAIMAAQAAAARPSAISRTSSAEVRGDRDWSRRARRSDRATWRRAVA